MLPLIWTCLALSMGCLCLLLLPSPCQMHLLSTSGKAMQLQTARLM